MFRWINNHLPENIFLRIPYILAALTCTVVLCLVAVWHLYLKPIAYAVMPGLNPALHTFSTSLEPLRFTWTKPGETEPHTIIDIPKAYLRGRDSFRAGDSLTSKRDGPLKLEAYGRGRLGPLHRSEPFLNRGDYWPLKVSIYHFAHNNPYASVPPPGRRGDRSVPKNFAYSQYHDFLTAEGSPVIFYDHFVARIKKNRSSIEFLSLSGSDSGFRHIRCTFRSIYSKCRGSFDYKGIFFFRATILRNELSRIKEAEDELIDLFDRLTVQEPPQKWIAPRVIPDLEID